MGLPYGFTSSSWIPPWFGRILINLKSAMVEPPPKLPAMAEQERNTAQIRAVASDLYGTQLFARWAQGLRQGPPIEGAMAYAPINAGSDIGSPEAGSFMSGGVGYHRLLQQAPTGPMGRDTSGPMAMPYAYIAPYGASRGLGTPGLQREDAVNGDEYPLVGDERRSLVSDTELQMGPIPFRIPRQFRMGLSHMAGQLQYGMPQHWDGGKRGDTLMLRPPQIPVTDGVNIRAIRAILGSVRAADTAHVPAVFTPRSVG